jgi:hypothetical protein
MEVAAVNSLLGSVLIVIAFACTLLGVIGGVVGAIVFRRSNRVWKSGLAGGIFVLVFSVLATHLLMYSFSYFAEKNVNANREMAATLPSPRVLSRSIASFPMDEKSLNALTAIGVGEPEIGLCLKIGCDITFLGSEPVISLPKTK